MSYDGLDRLTQTTSPSTVFNTASYSYDVLDNLLTVNVTGGSQARNHTYVYDATTRRLSQVLNTVGGAVVANLTWDVQGNLASKGPSGSVQSYSFDLGNRLRSVPGKETGYEYDGHSRRVYGLTVGSSHILSQYAHSGQLLYQENHKQSRRTDYIYLGNRLIAYRERPLSSTTVTLKYQHTDALGSPIAVTNTAMTVLETSEYEPYGQLVNKALFDGPGYTGHVQDAATGLTYMQQRYYDPGIGRFLSSDPVTAHEKPGHNFNRYWYANNNPYKLVDPDGRNAVAFIGGVATESWNALRGRGFDGKMVMGALVDGYDGEGDGFASAAFEDAITLIPVSAAAGLVFRGIRAAVQSARVTTGKVEGIGFARSQLQHAFKHAKDFGVSGNANNRTLAQFSSAINSHVSAPGTRAIEGTFRGNPVTHHLDPSTGLNVIRDSSGNFLSGWRLSPQQLEHVLTTGRLGGGP